MKTILLSREVNNEMAIWLAGWIPFRNNTYLIIPSGTEDGSQFYSSVVAD
jgi:hypothetical protein